MRVKLFGVDVEMMLSRQACEGAVHTEGRHDQSPWTGERLAPPSPRQRRPHVQPDVPMADPIVALCYLAASTGGWR
jgi:hypothetical protein